jgi:protein TonB
MNLPGQLEAGDVGSDLGITIVGAILLHIVLILGLNFTTPKPHSNDPLPELEITLVQTHTKTAPEKADFLANASQTGGGEHDKAERLKSPLPVPQEHTPAPVPPQQKAASVESSISISPKKELLLADKTRPVDLVLNPKQEKKVSRQQKQKTGIQPEIKELSREQLLAEISMEYKAYQKRPRRKFLRASTREYRFASYMDAWRSKVERIGNLNYPEEAKKRNLTGSLILDVAIKADGRIDSINVVRSSRIQALDDAAIRIVRLAAPYSPFPENIRKDYDVLHISRTWKFLHGDRLESQ